MLPLPCASLLVKKNIDASLLLIVELQMLYGLDLSVQAALAGVPPVDKLVVVQPMGVVLKFSSSIILEVGTGVERSKLTPSQTAADEALAVIDAGTELTVKTKLAGSEVQLPKVLVKV